MAQILVLSPGHYHRILNDVILVHGKTIGATGYAIYGYLCMRLNRKTGQCNPSIKRIAAAVDTACVQALTSCHCRQSHEFVKAGPSCESRLLR